jgi:hypothetical protein
MSVSMFRRPWFACPLVLLLVFALLLASITPALAQLPPPGGIKPVCKPMVCLANQAAKDQYAKENNCKFLDEICSSKTPQEDKDGAKDEDKGFWGELWGDIKGALVYGYEFVKGLLVGLKDQVADLVKMITNLDDVVGGLVELGKAFFDDPKGTLALMGEMLGQEGFDTVAKATQCGAYDLGHVIGSYVSPVFGLKLATTLSKYSGKLADASKAIKREYGCASFGAGTKVMTEAGPLAIELIRPGHVVASRNDMSFADRSQAVTDVMGRVAPSYRLLATEAGQFKVTGEHPLWVQGKGWTLADQVAADDVIAGEHGDILVHANEAVHKPLRVYNFSVANTENYFVGPGGMWAHNARNCNIGIYTTPWEKLKSWEIGFRAEYDIFKDFEKRGLTPVGNSFNPNGKNPQVAFSDWDGQTGIDGLYRDAKGNYVIVESKATGGKKKGEPDECVAQLCTMKDGERQMSAKWIADRLDKMGVTPAERKAIVDGLAANDGSVKRIYAQADGNGSSYHEINETAAGGVKVGKTWTPPPEKK